MRTILIRDIMENVIVHITKTIRAGEKLNTYLESASKILSRPPIHMLDEKTLSTSDIGQG